MSIIREGYLIDGSGVVHPSATNGHCDACGMPVTWVQTLPQPDGTISEADGTISEADGAAATKEEVRSILKGWYDAEGFGGSAHGAAQVAAAVYGMEWVAQVEVEWKLEKGELPRGEENSG